MAAAHITDEDIDKRVTAAKSGLALLDASLKNLRKAGLGDLAATLEQAVREAKRDAEAA
jgi:hypothetical protein